MPPTLGDTGIDVTPENLFGRKFWRENSSTESDGLQMRRQESKQISLTASLVVKSDILSLVRGVVKGMFQTISQEYSSPFLS